MKMAKKIVSKETCKKINKIEDKDEAVHALRYSIISKFKILNHVIMDEINNLEKESKDVFFAKNGSLLIPSKIKHLQVDFNEGDFYKLLFLVDKVKRELKNV